MTYSAAGEVRDAKVILQNVMEMLKEGLLSTLLPHNVTTREKIHREMDMNHIAKQIERDAFDIDYYIDFILATLATVCCPIRDKDILDVRKMTNTTNKVRKCGYH
ncbi:T-complex protein 11-like protein 2 [Orchesella cincta]|uniref:T-complex protein 11-like protein 2 n=1 Tax=Orchesella cincta TaxID=48709 RepID=A0A1D2MPU8_ORCCI|nr:T-complex protein 11-like protein 2 [Orchesella cincta]